MVVMGSKLTGRVKVDRAKEGQLEAISIVQMQDSILFLLVA
jgi:hypothetical protein